MLEKALAISCSLAVGLDQELTTALWGNDECVSGDTQCTLHALQARSAKSSTNDAVTTYFDNQCTPCPAYLYTHCLAGGNLTGERGCGPAGVHCEAQCTMETEATDVAKAGPPTMNDKFKNCVTAYHQTDPKWAPGILENGFDVTYVNGGGLAGKGMYFATSVEATEHKAEHHGYCFEVRICLGNSKVLPRYFPKGSCCTFEGLQFDGFDSATVDRGGFFYREYVVYRNDQMKVLKGWECENDGRPKVDNATTSLPS